MFIGLALLCAVIWVASFYFCSLGCTVGMMFGMVMFFATAAKVHDWYKTMKLPSDWARLKVPKIKSEAIVRAVNKLICDTWQYKERLGKDSMNLNHAEISVKCVYLVHNEVLMKQYCDALSGLCTDITLDSLNNGISTSNQSIECQVLTKAHGHAVGNLITDIDPDIKMTNLNDALNEVYLFHGTRKENLCSILENGFDLECAAEGLYGRSLYLADSSEKADQYTDDRSNRRKAGLFMMLVRTALGRETFVETKGKLNFCSDHTCFDRNCTQHPNKYDSAVAGLTARFREYMMFDMSKCYPQIIVEYDRKIDTSPGDNKTKCFIIGPRKEIKKLKEKNKEYKKEERESKKDQMDANATPCFGIQLPTDEEIINNKQSFG